MDIKEIRQKTGLTQKDFAEHYRIPLQTLKQWESRETSSSYRKPPEYIVHMLYQSAMHEFGLGSGQNSLRAERLMDAAEESREDMTLWFRYLRKEVDGKRQPLTEGDVRVLLRSDRLTRFQKISLSRAVTQGTKTNRFVRRMNAPAKPRRLEEIMRRHGHE